MKSQADLRGLKWGSSLLLQAGRLNRRVSGFCCCWGAALPLGLSLGLFLSLPLPLPGMFSSVEVLGMLSLLGVLSLLRTLSLLGMPGCSSCQSFLCLAALLCMAACHICLLMNSLRSLILQIPESAEQPRLLH